MKKLNQLQNQFRELSVLEKKSIQGQGSTSSVCPDECSNHREICPGTTNLICKKVSICPLDFKRYWRCIPN